MRHTFRLVVVAAAVAAIAALTASHTPGSAQDAPSGQERFVVFETFGDTG